MTTKILGRQPIIVSRSAGETCLVLLLRPLVIVVVVVIVLDVRDPKIYDVNFNDASFETEEFFMLNKGNE